MRKVIVFALMATLALAGTAFAQDQYDAGIFFDAEGTTPRGVVTGFVPFNVYVVGFGLDGQVKGFEGSIVRDPGLTVLSTVFIGPGPINVGTPENFVVGTGACVEVGQAVALVTYQMGYFAGPAAPSDMLFCLGSSSPSSFVPPAPGYLKCDNNLVPFAPALSGEGIYPDACAVGNPTEVGAPIPTDASSWSAFKSTF